MVFDPPSRQIAKTTLWASPHDQGASCGQVLSRPVFSGKLLLTVFGLNLFICSCSNNYCILLVFDPPSRHIAKTTVGTSPPNPGTSFDQVLSRPVFSGKSYEGFFSEKRICATYFPPTVTKAFHAAPAGPRAPAAGVRATRYIGLLDKKRLLDKPGD